MRGNDLRVRNANESAEDRYARACHAFTAARAEEDRHWRRLANDELVLRGRQPALDDVYMEAVERASLAQADMWEAARAMLREQPI
jgi:hypothetical protein